MQPRRRARLIAVGALLAVGATALALTGLASAVDETKPYTLSITATPDANTQSAGAEAWAGGTPAVRITFTNNAKTQQIGSANVWIPGGIVLSSDPAKAPALSGAGTATPRNGVIELRDIYVAPNGGTETLTVYPQVPCQPVSSYTWTTVAKQANDFNGTGNEFALTSAQPALGAAGTCTLVFPADSQPSATKKATNITREPYGYGYGAGGVAVEVRDGSGTGLVTWWTRTVTLSLPTNPAGGTLSGALTKAPATGTGRVTFATDGTGPRIDKSYGSYVLTATGDGIATPAVPVTSRPFAVADDGKRCQANLTCKGSASLNKTSVTLSSLTQANDLLTLSVGSPDLPKLDCPNYTETNDTALFDVTKLDLTTPAGGEKTLVYTFIGATGGPNQYQICFQKPGPFAAVGGPALETSPGSGLYYGLLPNCPRYLAGDTSVTPPCIADRQKRSGNVNLTVIAPQGDPLMRG